MSDTTYKVSFVFALILHLALMIFLFVKFVNSKAQVGLVAANDIINAVAINERDFDNQISKKVVQQESLPKKETLAHQEKVPQAAVKKPEKAVVKSQIQDMLKKDLLKERARELAELKKEQQEYNKNITEQKEQALQKMLQDQANAEQERLADARAAAHGSRLAGEVDKYKALIKQSIYLQWNIPEGTNKGDFCRFLIDIGPGGVVLDVKLTASSGNQVLERSAQAAILKAAPLPIPEDIKLFDEVKAVDFTFRPEGIVNSV